jgi:hypothetical protein
MVVPRALAAIRGAVGFALGAVLGIPIGWACFAISLYRGARAVHAEGAMCRAAITARDPVVAARLAGPALVRLSGAFHGQRGASHDVLCVAIRMQRTASDDPSQGDQDLSLASFESFATARRSLADTDIEDYLANHYSTVAPWWIDGLGPVVLRLVPPPPLPADRAGDRVARLDADLAADRARFELAIDTGSARHVIAELRLVERLATDDRALRTSMFRQGRGIRPVGVRNGIRAAVYPMSQIARRLRGG